MNLTFEKPEPLVMAGVNWPLLEYLIERFNRPDLQGVVILRRTGLLRELQLILLGECNGVTFSVLSESFNDSVVILGLEKERMVSLVSRFLLKAKNQHREIYATLPPGSADL
ncbi:MAG: hypothetical protein EOP84_21850 [Verrucomicrobiaceae bacterium]|nr:MAG: hypothetical protein EOP84_21850 [Verrucomicrobiaceae bacterium]